MKIKVFFCSSLENMSLVIIGKVIRKVIKQKVINISVPFLLFNIQGMD